MQISKNELLYGWLISQLPNADIVSVHSYYSTYNNALYIINYVNSRGIMFYWTISKSEFDML